MKILKTKTNFNYKGGAQNQSEMKNIGSLTAVALDRDLFIHIPQISI